MQIDKLLKLINDACILTKDGQVIIEMVNMDVTEFPSKNKSKRYCIFIYNVDKNIKCEQWKSFGTDKNHLKELLYQELVNILSSQMCFVANKIHNNNGLWTALSKKGVNIAENLIKESEVYLKNDESWAEVAAEYINKK